MLRVVLQHGTWITAQRTQAPRQQMLSVPTDQGNGSTSGRPGPPSSSVRGRHEGPPRLSRAFLNTDPGNAFPGQPCIAAPPVCMHANRSKPGRKSGVRNFGFFVGRPVRQLIGISWGQVPSITSVGLVPSLGTQSPGCTTNAQLQSQPGVCSQDARVLATMACSCPAVYYYSSSII